MGEVWKMIFYRYGNIETNSLIKDNQSRPTVIAFIILDSLDHAKTAREEAMKDWELDERRIVIDNTLTKIGHMPTPGHGYKGKHAKSPRGCDRNDRCRHGYSYSNRSSGQYGKRWNRGYGNESQKPQSSYGRRRG